MKHLLFLLFLILSVKFQAQDVIFSQNFLVPETLNTSFTGAIRSTKLGSVHKSQWHTTTFKTNSSFVYLDTWYEGYKMGLGVSFLNQTELASTYSFNQVNFNYSMAFQLNDTWFFRPSISAGFGMKNYGFQNILLGDQININNNSINASSVDPLLLGTQRNFFDFSSSILFNNDDSWIGLTLRHLNKPNISLTDSGNIPLDVFISLHTKYYLPLLENYRTWFASKSKIYVLSNFMVQGNVNRFDLGLQYIFDNQFSFGVTAATVPIKNQNTSSTLSSVSTFAGIKWQGFRFGYSYDFNTTNLNFTGGTHGFSVAYDFNINIRELNRYKCVSYF